ncbi:protein CHUP1, chloroplastic-like [Nicotiana tabacum]|uniref:Protein CHUP1, chloroplastic-like n=2 Tax=Nicotiana TaxID=4085 RepID=A0A1S4BKA5_TOBAC|nr:PREDICTED: protein CHUP1, chloroplastic-like [Nicotiana tabacum]
MGGEEDEEAAIVSTYGSDMTYNQMSNMGYKIAAEVRKGVTSLTHTDEDLLKLLGRQKNRYSDVEEVECLRLITAELRLELRNPQLHEEILAKLRKRVIDTDTSGYLLSLLGHQKDEYSDVEEVVYLRSLAAILRHEIWNNPRPKLEYAASECDLRDTLSPKSEEKAKQLILECAASECDQWDTDLASSLSLPSSPGSEDNDITVNDSSSGRYRNSSQNSQFYSKLKRLIGQE